MEMLPHVKLNPNFNKYDGSNNPPPVEKGEFVWIYFQKVKVCGTKNKFLHNFSGPYLLLQKNGWHVHTEA